MHDLGTHFGKAATVESMFLGSVNDFAMLCSRGQIPKIEQLLWSKLLLITLELKHGKLGNAPTKSRFIAWNIIQVNGWFSRRVEATHHFPPFPINIRSKYYRSLLFIVHSRRSYPVSHVPVDHYFPRKSSYTIIPILIILPKIMNITLHSCRSLLMMIDVIDHTQ